LKRVTRELETALATHEGLARKLEALEKKYDRQFKVVFDAIRELMAPLVGKSKRRKVGFHVVDDK